MYAVVQIGHVIYGIGETEEEAIKDARQWMDEIDNQSFDGQPTQDAQICVLPCSDALAQAVSESGGDIAFDIIDGNMVILAGEDNNSV